MLRMAAYDVNTRASATTRPGHEFGANSDSLA